MSSPIIGPTRTVNVPVGIATTPQATAANVLQSTPVTDMLVGQQSSVARPGLAGTTPDGRPITTTDFQSVYVDGAGMNVPRPQMSVINTAAADPMTQLSQEQAIFGLGDNAPGARTTAPASAPVTDAGLYGGYEDDPAYDADIFGMPRYAGGQTGLDGQMQGFEDARQMGDFVNSATQGNFLPGS